jgi:hypothetical protein
VGLIAGNPAKTERYTMINRKTKRARNLQRKRGQFWTAREFEWEWLKIIDAVVRGERTKKQ